mgnify:CR=1 FL=1
MDMPWGAIHSYMILFTALEGHADVGVTWNFKPGCVLSMATTPSADVISNYQYEQSLQDEKRKIRLIQPRFISDFVVEFEAKIKEGA